MSSFDFELKLQQLAMQMSILASESEEFVNSPIPEELKEEALIHFKQLLINCATEMELIENMKATQMELIENMKAAQKKTQVFKKELMRRVHYRLVMSLEM